MALSFNKNSRFSVNTLNKTNDQFKNLGLKWILVFMLLIKAILSSKWPTATSNSTAITYQEAIVFYNKK